MSKGIHFDEIILSTIFSYFQFPFDFLNKRLVCKQWKEIMEETLQKINLTELLHNYPQLCEHYFNMDHLQQSKEDKLLECLTIAFKVFPKIDEIIISKVKLSDKLLRNLAVTIVYGKCPINILKPLFDFNFKKNLQNYLKENNEMITPIKTIRFNQCEAIADWGACGDTNRMYFMELANIPLIQRSIVDNYNNSNNNNINNKEDKGFTLDINNCYGCESNFIRQGIEMYFGSLLKWNLDASFTKLNKNDIEAFIVNGVNLEEFKIIGTNAFDNYLKESNLSKEFKLKEKIENLNLNVETFINLLTTTIDNYNITKEIDITTIEKEMNNLKLTFENMKIRNDERSLEIKEKLNEKKLKEKQLLDLAFGYFCYNTANKLTNEMKEFKINEMIIRDGFIGILYNIYLNYLLKKEREISKLKITKSEKRDGVLLTPKRGFFSFLFNFGQQQSTTTSNNKDNGGNAMKDKNDELLRIEMVKKLIEIELKKSKSETYIKHLKVCEK
ncbi:hypothetical protein ABK040_014777 [Willaertia magna]